MMEHISAITHSGGTRASVQHGTQDSHRYSTYTTYVCDTLPLHMLKEIEENCAQHLRMRNIECLCELTEFP
jgi:hypothetical protein